MRSAAELRQRWLNRIPSLITRAGMYTAGGGAAFDIRLRELLDDLCFLDERDSDANTVHEVIHTYGKLGVVGPFIALFGKDGNYLAEVASVWAQQLHRLGYLSVDRLLDSTAWTRLIAELRKRFDGKDLRRSEVEAAFGAPCILADRRVLCYAPSDGSGWVFFDCHSEPNTRYAPGKGRYDSERDDDPLVRSVRRPAADFESGLILTLYGKVLRWGPGWWLEHSSDLSDERSATAAQLRDVESRRPVAAQTTPGPPAPRARHLK